MNQIETILDRIGNTPLIKIQNIDNQSKQRQIYSKLEYFNPGGSVKDRSVMAMVQEGIKSGKLTKDKIILDSTSGNAGIAYAMIGAVLGYEVMLCIPDNVSDERKKILNAFGAKLIYTDPLESSDGAIKKAKELVQEDPKRFFYPDQYNNMNNILAHYETTGVEILKQTEGKITHFISGIGTGGTIMGVGKRLKEHNPNIKVIAVEPDSPLHGIEGLKHMESSIKPGIYDEKFPDEVINVTTEDAQKMTKLLAKKEGLLLGTSSGAAMKAAIEIDYIENGLSVVLFPDGIDRYLTEKYWGTEELWS